MIVSCVTHMFSIKLIVVAMPLSYVRPFSRFHAAAADDKNIRHFSIASL